MLIGRGFFSPSAIIPTFRPAFTLVELLIVIATLGLLLSIACPALVRLKEPARRAMCADNLRGLMDGMLAYAGDHQGRGPLRGYWSYTIAERGGWGYHSVKVPVNLGMLYGRWIGKRHDMLYCPATYETFRDNARYGWKTAFDPNVMYTYTNYDYAVVLERRSRLSPVLGGENPFPEEIWSSRFEDWVHGAWQSRHPGETFQMPHCPALVFDGYSEGIAPVHGGGVNALYFDGHVRYQDLGSSLSSVNTMQFDVWYKLSLRQ